MVAADLSSAAALTQPRRLLHVIEPTLQDYAGHCYGLVRSFCEAAPNLNVKLWGGRGSAALDFGRVAAMPYFHRRLRLFQLGMLLRRLLQEPEPVLIMTARRSDLSLARLAARGVIPAGKLYLYFHWYRETPSRLEFLRRVARTQPNIAILATTPTVADVFTRAGFRQVILLPYPLTAQRPADCDTSASFTHLLYAGAARQDKGFTLVVDLIERLAAEQSDIPIKVQISADHYGKHDSVTRADIARLEQVNHSALTIVRETLDPAGYAALFRGGLCLQPYDAEAFRDRASGVTLDALAHGCPVIVPAQTWMANLMAPQQAGVELDSVNLESLSAAVKQIIGNYPAYQRNALAAGSLLRQRSWQPFLDLLNQ
jgi:glycosyltransferase involved in cell wall biosynthesis